MAKTKKRILDDVDTENEIVVPPTKQVVDDQTPIDALDKKSKEKLPKGYTKRLPEGVVRKVSVNKDEIGEKDSKVISVLDTNNGEVISTDRIRIEGGCELIHDTRVGCSVRGRVYIETSGSILVGKTKKQ